MKYDGLILDVDGTLWDSTDVVAASWQRTIDESFKAGKITNRIDITAEVLQSQFGKTMEVIADNLFPDETKEARMQLLSDCCINENDDLRDSEMQTLYEGVFDTIVKVSKTIPVFIVSNCQKGYIETLVAKYGLAPYITDTECYGNNGYEKDVNIRLLADRNGLSSPVYVGDTAGDKEACDKALVPMIFASYGFGQAEGTVATIDSFSQICEILDESL